MIDELDTIVLAAKGLQDYLCLQDCQVLDVGCSLLLYVGLVFWAIKQDSVNRPELFDRKIANSGVEKLHRLSNPV
jgi:hypothetical protein